MAKDDLHRQHLEEVQFHLDRLNQYGWTRIGLLVDRILARLLKFLRRLQPSEPALETVDTEALLGAEPVPSSIAFDPIAANPDVSVVILSFGHCDYTRRWSG